MSLRMSAAQKERLQNGRRLPSPSPLSPLRTSWHILETDSHGEIESHDSLESHDTRRRQQRARRSEKTSDRLGPNRTGCRKGAAHQVERFPRHLIAHGAGKSVGWEEEEEVVAERSAGSGGEGDDDGEN